ncbi:unnamed protein product, partial [Prorocentrum cordatum]
LAGGAFESSPRKSNGSDPVKVGVPLFGSSLHGRLWIGLANLKQSREIDTESRATRTSADLSTTDCGSVVGALEDLPQRSCDGGTQAAASKIQCQCSRPCRFRHKCRRADCDFCHLHHAAPTSFAIARKARQDLSLDMKTDPMHDLIDSTLRWWNKGNHKRRKQALRLRSLCFRRLQVLRAAELAREAGAAAGVEELRQALAAVRAEHERLRDALPRSLEGLYAVCGSTAPDVVEVPERSM